jgi:UDP-N-acetylglucosamine diphosphorylase / glucose-1-phosphate thymidylyltransferase / UDP-N-acetylgalactosamine diphosphorylase / glucosamine-1-phosphate N-acetyltransferase / galactosamine-1-phosphate N-acetyltransferase
LKAIVLAAGLGTRLRPVTNYVPKPLIPFFGKPFLRYTLESVAGFVDEIAIVVHHRAEMIRDAIGQHVDGVPIQYVEQARLRGTGDALLSARQFLEDRTLVILGDVNVSPGLIEELLDVQTENVLSLAEVDDPQNHLGVSFKGGFATELFSDSHWVDRGVWMLSPGVLAYLESVTGDLGELRLMGGVQRMLEEGVVIGVCCSKEPWVQIGDHTGVSGVIEAMRHIGGAVGTDCPEGSVDAATADCAITDSVVVGPGELRNSRVDRSLVYVYGLVDGAVSSDGVYVLGQRE